MPGFESVHEQAGSRVAFLGVSQSDAKSASLGLVHKTAVTYPTAIDAHGAFFSAVGTGGMPTTLFILPGGKIAYIQIGPLDERTLKQDIQSYLRVSV